MSNEPEMSFSELVLGFSSAALSYMGYETQDAKTSKNLTLARQNISIIELLNEKTKGNLSSEEQELLEGVLSDLRLRFVEISKK